MPAPRATRFEPAAYAALRIVSGGLFAFHGVQKILGWVATKAPPAGGSQLWIGGVIELIGGVLIALGVFTVHSAFLCSGTMAVAYTQFHWKLSFGKEFFPGVNKGELALLYSVLFLFFACKGSGPFSVDVLREKKNGA